MFQLKIFTFPLIMMIESLKRRTAIIFVFLLKSFLFLNSAAGTKLEYPTVDNRLGGKPKGKLTLPDIKSLDPSTKLIYLAV